MKTTDYTEGTDQKEVMKDMSITLWVNLLNPIIHSLSVFIREIRGSNYSSVNERIGTARGGRTPWPS